MSDGTEAVLCEVRDRIAWITINRPGARNASNKAARDGIRDAFVRFNEDDGAAVAVLTGAGDKAFCAGGDLAVNGVAYAGGFLLAQQVDLVVAVEGARFAITESSS